MEFPEQISTRITATIASQLKEYPDEKLEQINYGIAVFITNSYKLLIMFVIAFLLKVFWFFLTALMSFGLLRSFASGVHAKREWTCLPSSVLLFSSIIYAGHYMEEMEKISDKICVIDRGRCVLFGDVKELLKDNKRLEQLYLEVTGSRQL
jgi:accessory gene regulator protein AgrB